MASSSSPSPSEAKVPCAGYLYPPGGDLKIESFRPFQPFGDSWYEPPFDRDETYGKAEDISTLSTEDYVFTKPSREPGAKDVNPEFAKSYLDSPKDNAKLRITGGLSMSTGLGAQVLLCEVKTQPRKLWKAMGFAPHDAPNKLVAKVFDPLYFPKADPFHRYNDVVSMADKAFAHEAAAYMELHHFRKEKPIIDELVPKFYGTFSITHTRRGPGSASRQVHVVLMEYIPGDTIFDMSAGKYNKNHLFVLKPPADVGDKPALQVFARVLHGLVALEHIGVFQQDISSCNVIVSQQHTTESNKEPEPKWERVVLVDFDISRVSRYTKDKTHLAQDLAKPMHPAVRFDLGGLDTFAGWFPVDWWIECEERQAESSDDDESEENSEYDIDNDKRLLLWEEWALETLKEKDFTMGDEADIVARVQRLAREAKEAEEAKKIEEAKNIEKAKNIAEA